MTKKQITAAQALQALREAVAERGADYVDPYSHPDSVRSCAYATYDENSQLVPGCGVGLALVRIGVPLDVIARDGGSVYDVHERDQLPIRMTKRAVDVLAAFQFHQDDGYTWGESLGNAEEMYNSEHEEDA